MNSKRLERVRGKMKDRTYHVPEYSSFDMVIDGTGIRLCGVSFSSLLYSTPTETAIVVPLEYDDETKRTIDSVLLGESQC